MNKKLIQLSIILVILILSQYAFKNVWLYQTSFNYDAFTTFNNWNIHELNDLKRLYGLLNIYDEHYALNLSIPYFYQNIIRVFTSLLPYNSYEFHSMLQAVHALLTVIAVSFLIHSFRIPLVYSFLGGFIYLNSGINISLNQHTAGHEALSYLSLSLLFIRLLIQNIENKDKRIIYTIASIVSLGSLIIHVQEAVQYFVPVSLWVIFHFYFYWTNKNFKLLLSYFFIITLALIINSIPFLSISYEMSFINKTLVTSYEETGGYSHLLFFPSLVMASASGALYYPTSSFILQGDANLWYIFSGSLTFSAFIYYIFIQIKRKQYLTLGVYLFAYINLIGYAWIR